MMQYKPQDSIRTMRILPFKCRSDGSDKFTLVMEWFEDGKSDKITRDARYIMNAEEFNGLFDSALEAIKTQETN